MDRLPLEELREIQIAEILRRNRNAFETYVQSSNFRKQEFPTDESVLQFLVPEEILRSSLNPDKVRLKKLSGSGILSFWYSIEEDGRPLTNNAPLTEEQKEFLVFARRDEELIDQDAYIYLVCQGTRRVGESLPQVVDINQYQNNPDIKNKGITTGFYKNFDEFLARLGFEQVVGENNAKNINFFLQKLGRNRLKNYPDFWILSPKKDDMGRKIFPPSEFITFKNLYEKDVGIN